LFTCSEGLKNRGFAQPLCFPAMRRTPSAAAILCVVGCVCVGATASAEGLRVGTSLSAMRFANNGQVADLYYLNNFARVSRGQASLAVGAPVAFTNGTFAVSSDNPVVVGSGQASAARFGLGDMMVALDYNLVQDRQNMFIVTLGGTMRFPTAAAGLGNGEHLYGFSLSTVYGITRQLMAFAEFRQMWRGILAPAESQIRMGELGAIYWFTDKFGLTASVSATDYGPKLRLPFSVETNLGVAFEAFPGVMMNAGGLAGLSGVAPQMGGMFGFGFEI